MRLQCKTVTAGALVSWILLACFAFAQGPGNLPKAASDRGGHVGNEACAQCHASKFESYQHTAMARASGPAAENLIAGDFSDAKSGVNYRIYTEGGKVWLSFDRPGDPSVRGKRELLYYIGQGRRGRTYLILGRRLRLRVAGELVQRSAHVGHGSRIRRCARNPHESARAGQLP